MSGRYKPYPEYRDSGIELLGDFPNHWKVTKFRYLFNLGKGLTITKTDLKDEGIPCVNYGEVHSKYGFRVDPEIHPLKCVGKEYLNSSSGALLERGDLVFADTSEDLEGAGNFTQSVGIKPLFAGYHTIIARADRSNNTDFLSYAIDSEVFRTQIQLAVKGVKVFSITQAILRGTDLWLPPIAEQIQIAEFLDYETEKIDLLIEKQLSLIAVLKEKRQAVISHAVTKGLNPDAPMKDSGVEWLGNVPEHWGVRSISSLTTKITNGFVGPTRGILVDEGVRYLQSLHIKQNEIQFRTPYYVTKEWSNEKEKSILGKGDVLVVQTGDIGQVAVVPEEFAGCNCHALIILTPRRDEVSGDWLSWVLNSDYGFHCLQAIKTGALHPHLNCGNVKFLKLPLPPQDEQAEVVKFIAKRLGDFDNLTVDAQRAIDLLQERRAALISAAVTGKIDVRDWTAPEPDATANHE